MLSERSNHWARWLWCVILGFYNRLGRIYLAWRQRSPLHRRFHLISNLRAAARKLKLPYPKRPYTMAILPMSQNLRAAARKFLEIRKCLFQLIKSLNYFNEPCWWPLVIFFLELTRLHDGLIVELQKVIGVWDALQMMGYFFPKALGYDVHSSYLIFFHYTETQFRIFGPQFTSRGS